MTRSAGTLGNVAVMGGCVRPRGHEFLYAIRQSLSPHRSRHLRLAGTWQAELYHLEPPPTTKERTEYVRGARFRGGGGEEGPGTQMRNVVNLLGEDEERIRNLPISSPAKMLLQHFVVCLFNMMKIISIYAPRCQLQ